MQSEYFPGGSIVAAAGTEADRLMIIVSGYIRSPSLVIGRVNALFCKPNLDSRLPAVAASLFVILFAIIISPERTACHS